METLEDAILHNLYCRSYSKSGQIPDMLESLEQEKFPIMVITTAVLEVGNSTMDDVTIITVIPAARELEMQEHKDSVIADEGIAITIVRPILHFPSIAPEVVQFFGAAEDAHLPQGGRIGTVPQKYLQRNHHQDMATESEHVHLQRSGENVNAGESRKSYLIG